MDILDFFFSRRDGGGDLLWVPGRQGGTLSTGSGLTYFHFQMEEAKKAIDKLDVDKDGKVSYPEFILVMKYKK